MGTEAGEILDATAQPQAEVSQPTQEVKPNEPQGSQTVDPKLAGRLEILMRREQGILSREGSIKAQEAALQEKLKLIEKFEEAKKGNAKTALELLGLDYNQLSEAILKDGELPPEVHIKKLEDRLSEQDKRWEEEQKKREEEKKALQAQAETKAVTDFKKEIATYITDNKTRYELSHFEYGDEAQEIIFDVIDEHYTRTLNPETGTGKVLSLKEAADKVEEFLEKKYAKAKEAEKIKALWGAIPKSTQETLAKQLSEKKQPVGSPKTLTNNMTPAPSVKVGRPSEEERVRGIVAQFRAQHGI